MFSDLTRYESAIPDVVPTSLASLGSQLRIFQDDDLAVWYSPHGEANISPKLWILGITPGWNQMRIAYEDAASAMREGLSSIDAARIKKPRVAFAGSMRNNLIAMMDELGFAQFLNVGTSAELFDDSASAQLIRTGSVLKYPVFIKDKNYTGYSPKPLRHTVLKDMIDTVFAAELNAVANCLILPLGKTVESILDYSVAKGKLDQARILRGFPHPSGANGHRLRIFQQNKNALRQAITSWFAA